MLDTVGFSFGFLDLGFLGLDSWSFLDLDIVLFSDIGLFQHCKDDKQAAAF
jgi:hypothetical protein